MKPISFIVITKDNFLKTELRSLFTPPNHQAVFFEDAAPVIKSPESLLNIKYVVIDTSNASFPESLICKMPHISFIFLTSDYNTPVPACSNCRKIDKENLISVIQQYKFGVVLDQKLAV